MSFPRKRESSKDGVNSSGKPRLRSPIFVISIWKFFATTLAINSTPAPQKTSGAADNSWSANYNPWRDYI